MHSANQSPRRMRSIGPSAVLGVMLSAVLLAACGSPTTSAPAGTASPSPTAAATGSGDASSASPAASPSATAAGVDACALAAPAELADIVGGAVTGAGMPASGWVATQCSWFGSTSSFILSIGTAASIQASGDAAAIDAKAKLAQYKQQAGTTDVPAIGDGAARGPNGMAAFKGGTYVELEILRLTDDQLTKVMKLLVSKL